MIAPFQLDRGLPMEELRALVVGPYPLVLASLARLLAAPPLNARVEVTTRSDKAVRQALSGQFQLVFCDLRAEPIPGAEVATMLKPPLASTRVVLLADVEDIPLLLASAECGAAGLFTKDAAADEFLEGIQAIWAGHFTIGRNLVAPALARIAGRGQSEQAGPLTRLSATEKKILTMAGLAQSTRSIAQARGISPKTVRNHMANIYRKLGLRNRSEAILWSARLRRSQEHPDNEPRADARGEGQTRPPRAIDPGSREASAAD